MRMRWLSGGAWLCLVLPAQTVDFARDIRPLLAARCGSCHGGEKPQGGLRVASRAALLRGGQSGPAIVPGDSRASLLLQRVTGFAAPVMPFGAEPLSDRQIELLRAWIDAGAPESNPIDALLNVTAAPAGDAVFLRRAYLDLWGLPPSPEDLAAFLADAAPGKRERLVDRLLSDRRNYAEHWISFWNDLLRNDEGVIYHGARKSISTWLLKALEDNLPYDRFVSALLNPAQPDDPDGFLLGVNWRGDVSASQTPVMQAAQNSAQVFLGVNLKCNSCHDSFISNWKLKDAYGLAAFFADSKLEMFRCDVPTGEVAEPRFLFPELGGVDAAAPLPERRAAAARLFTARDNPRFARTAVNRIWKRLMGWGLVEPVDEMDHPPWNPALLDALAADFVDHGYDLHHLLRRILTSRAYQLPAGPKPAPAVRRLTAEQFVDSLSAITGEWRLLEPLKPGIAVPSREWRLKSSALTRALGRPIRDQVYTERNHEATTLQALELANGASLSRLLHRGARRLLGELQPSPQNLFDSGIVRSEKIPVDLDITGLRELRLLVVDADSYDRSRVLAGWLDAELIGPSGSTRLADAAPGAVPSERVYNLAGKGYTRFRAVALVDDRSKQSDINPRVRFFVFDQPPDPEQLVRAPFAGQGAALSLPRLYRHVYGRDPNPAELRIAREFLAEGAEGLEDLLWSLFLSPEFQYLH
jgi:hypothetical protein